MPYFYSMNALREQFLLKPDITFLNFGSFGACPKPILEKWQSLQREFEEEPIQFMTVKGPLLLAQSRAALAQFIGCEANEVVYVTNPSYAVSIITHALYLRPGDEILTTDLEYGACDRAWDQVCRTTGAKLIRVKVPFPFTDSHALVHEMERHITPATKLIFMSHITSATSLIFPAKEVCDLAKQHGILSFIDGAHVPAHLPLNLKSLGADIYTGACHKWMMGPKGTSFLYLSKDLHKIITPLVVSWGFDPANPDASDFVMRHEVQGTRDITGFLTIPTCIEFMQTHAWETVSANCRELVKQYASKFSDLCQTPMTASADGRYTGQMYSMQINCKEPMLLQRHLYEQYQIEIPVMQLGDRVFIRYSINAFNRASDLDKLYMALSQIIQSGNYITT